MQHAPARIGFIGSGNVATHLACGFAAAGLSVCQVISRNISHAKALATQIDGCVPLDDIALLDKSLDCVIISTSDASVAEIAAQISDFQGVLMHTSGSIPMTVLAGAAKRYGVLYPLQTFSREANVDLSEVPFFTEASDDEALAVIDSLASMLSHSVHHADSAQRRTLHIAGVLSCNFVTYLWQCATEQLQQDGYDFSVVAPLIRATLDKTLAVGAHQAQTGPARRGDVDVMLAHINRLPEPIKSIYREMSQAIMDSHSVNKSL
jgi:predicted short-subunit dehydrogenase-like oxidoreductase (DUF2520 family)